MKKLIIASLLLSTFSYAKDCKDFINVEDRIKTIISCDNIENMGSGYAGDSACITVVESAIANFNLTFFVVEPYRNNDNYSLIVNRVSIGKNGYKSMGKITSNENGDTLLESIFSPNGLALKSEINLKNPSELKLQIFEKKIFKDKLIEKAIYRCHKII